MQPGQPERLVGVDVADPRDQGLIQQRPFHPGPATSQAGRETRFIEGRVERVSRYVPQRCRQTGGIAPFEEHPPEGALIDEPQLGAAVGERDPYPQVPFLGRSGRRHEQLAAHAEVSYQRIARIQGQPQVLSATAGRDQPAARDPTGEVVCAGHVAAHGTGVVHGGRGDRAPDDHLDKSTADHLDLG